MKVRYNIRVDKLTNDFELIEALRPMLVDRMSLTGKNSCSIMFDKMNETHGNY